MLFLPDSGPLLSFRNIFKEQQCNFTEINVTFRLLWKKKKTQTKKTQKNQNKKFCGEITSCSLHYSPVCSLSYILCFSALNIPLMQHAAGLVPEQQMNQVGRSSILLDSYHLTPYWDLTALRLQTLENHDSYTLSVFTEMLFCFCNLLSVSCTLRPWGCKLCLLYFTYCQAWENESVNNIFFYQLNELLRNCGFTEIGGKIVSCINNTEEMVMILRWPVIRRRIINISTMQWLSLAVI